LCRIRRGLATDDYPKPLLTTTVKQVLDRKRSGAILAFFHFRVSVLKAQIVAS
jgi:hypothetical protein